MTSETIEAAYARETVLAACQSKSFLAAMGRTLTASLSHPRLPEQTIETAKVLAGMVDAAKRAGYKLTGDARLADSYAGRMVRLLKHSKNPERFYKDVGAEIWLLTHAVDGLLKAGCTFAPEQPAAPKPQAIHVHLPSPPKAEHEGPLKVEVVAMPARERTTTVTRDERENIVETVTVETDQA